jgi:hypothetical protein
VRGEVPPYTLVAGNPARTIASLRDTRTQEQEAPRMPAPTTEHCGSGSDRSGL